MTALPAEKSTTALELLDRLLRLGPGRQVEIRFTDREEYYVLAGGNPLCGGTADRLEKAISHAYCSRRDQLAKKLEELDKTRSEALARLESLPLEEG